MSISLSSASQNGLNFQVEFPSQNGFNFEVKEVILEITTNMGFPRGGVCSAKFCIIAFDEAAKILNTNGVSGEHIADDRNGIIGGKDIEYMAQRLNRVCRDLSAWGNKCGLKFNAKINCNEEKV